MAIVTPNIWNKSGSLVQNVPVILDPQADAGFVATYWEIFNAGSKNITATILGSAWVIPPSIGLKVPGPIFTITLVCTDAAGSGYLALASNGQGQLPAFDITAGAGGGGGGGGAPANAKYLINDSTVPGSLTQAVPIKALPFTLAYTKDETGSGPGTMSTPINLVNNLGGGQTAAAGAGVALAMIVLDQVGNKTYGEISAKLRADTKTNLVFKGIFGTPIATFEPHAVGQVNGLVLDGAIGEDLGLVVTGGADAHFKSVSGKLQFDTGANNLATLDASTGLTFHFPSWTYISSANKLSVISGSHILDAIFGQDHGSFISFGDAITNGLIWSDHKTLEIKINDLGVDGFQFKTDQLKMPAVTITNLANGVASSDAATIGQLTVATVTFGAISTGTIAETPYLKVGGAFAVADNGLSSTDIWYVPDVTLVQSGTIVCDTGPAGHDQDFQVFKNNVYTGFHMLLAVGDNSGVFSGTPFTCALTDAVTVKAVNSGDVADVGALNVLVTLGHKGY